MAWPENKTLAPKPGSIPLQAPCNAAWRSLLPRAAALIEAAGRLPLRDLTLGGGSMLTARYGHRESRDLDFFLPDAQLLGTLSPRLNDSVTTLVDAYDEGSNYLKFTFGTQEIDFIVGAPVLDRAPTQYAHLSADLAVPIEPPGEIVAKKILYRGRSFTHRDVIDLAVVQALEPAELAHLPDRIGGKAIASLRTRLEAMRAGFEQAATSRVTMLQGYEGIIKVAHDLAVQATDALTESLRTSARSATTKTRPATKPPIRSDQSR